MTPTPWRFIEDGLPLGWTDIVSDSLGQRPAYIGDAKTVDAAAIVSAVNATYGAGIAPEAVAGLVDALEMALRWTEEVPSPYREFPFIIAARAALAKARITP